MVPRSVHAGSTLRGGEDGRENSAFVIETSGRESDETMVETNRWAAGLLEEAEQGV